MDGLAEWQIVLRIMLPLSKSAIATNVILAFIWSWNNFLWPLIITRDADLQTLPLGLARFLSLHEDTTGALYAFCVLVLAPGIAAFPDGAEGVHSGPDLRGDQGMIPSWLLSRWVVVPAVLILATVGWNAWVTCTITDWWRGTSSAPTGRRWWAPRWCCWSRTSRLFPSAGGRSRRRGRLPLQRQPDPSRPDLAEKPGIGRSDRTTLRLWFRSQDSVLPQALELRP